jgi:hypothetical protein
LEVPPFDPLLVPLLDPWLAPPEVWLPVEPEVLFDPWLEPLVV